MKQPLISVIIPVYNVADYLEACVQSVLSQSVKDWEILLVDDGSSDGSEILCDRFTAADSRIKVIHQENRGVGAARNTGIDNAAGDYILFLDSDDTLLPNSLEILLDAARKSRAEVTEGSVEAVSPEGEILWEASLPENVREDPTQIVRSFLQNPYRLFCCWNKLILRSSLGETRFRSFTRGEDALFCAELLSRCSRYVSTGEIIYRYLIRQGSVMHRDFSASMMDFPRSWSAIAELLTESNPELVPMAAAQVVYQTDKLYQLGLASGSGDWSSCRRELIQIRKKWYLRQFQRHIPLKKLISFCFFVIIPDCYFKRSSSLSAGR